MSDKQLCDSIGCINVDPHYHTAKGIEYSRMELIEVMVERDKLERVATEMERIRDTALIHSPGQKPTADDYKAMWAICVKLATDSLAALREGKP